MKLDCDSIGHPLANKELESKANQLNTDLSEALTVNHFGAKSIAEKQIVLKFIDETSRLTPDDRYQVYSRAQEINDKGVCNQEMLPQINIVFGSTPFKGAPALERFQIASGPRSEVFDMYVPKGPSERIDLGHQY